MGKIACLLGAFIVITVFLTGCNQARRTLRVQRQKSVLIKELYDAVRNQDHRIALNKLERVGELDIEPTFIHHLSRRKTDDFAVFELSGLLDSGSTIKALEYIDNQIDLGGPSPRLINSRKFVDHLRHLEVYLTKKPYDRIKDAESALSELPDETGFQTRSAVYERFIQKEKAELARLKREETARLILELMREIDIALVTGSNLEPLIIAQLRTLDSEFDASDNWLALMSGVSNKLVLEAVETIIPRSQSHRLVRNHEDAARELALFRLAQIDPNKAHDGNLRSLVSTQPSSFAGALITINDQISSGNYLPAFTQLSEVIRLIPGLKPVTIPIAREYMRRELLDITPSVHGILHHLYYIQN